MKFSTFPAPSLFLLLSFSAACVVNGQARADAGETVKQFLDHCEKDPVWCRKETALYMMSVDNCPPDMTDDQYRDAIVDRLKMHPEWAGKDYEKPLRAVIRSMWSCEK